MRTPYVIKLCEFNTTEENYKYEIENKTLTRFLNHSEDIMREVYSNRDEFEDEYKWLSKNYTNIISEIVMYIESLTINKSLETACLEMEINEKLNIKLEEKISDFINILLETKFLIENNSLFSYFSYEDISSFEEFEVINPIYENERVAC
ncbi:hypothetical protein [Macrococcoides caseolyticum]|uniref:hypothetical protein n=1 Tax=Macrococcoides caseolyticum TaxID=69966 RepID=UPI0011A289F5|nr:hypothetical protein [Macrococcus caseolyticus]